MPRPVEDPETERFSHSGAEVPGYGRAPSMDLPESKVDENISTHHGGSPKLEELRQAVARVHRPAPTPMQRGHARQGEWVVEFEPHLKPGTDPLMGWISSADPLQQVRLSFHSLEQAEAYCRRQNLVYEVEHPGISRTRLRTYAENYEPFDGGAPRPIYPH